MHKLIFSRYLLQNLSISKMNSSSNSSAEAIVPLCERSTHFCIAETWFVNLIYIINTLSALINIFHIFMLSKFKSILEAIYLKMLIIMTILDIVCSVAIMGKVACSLRQLNSTTYPVAVVLLFITDSSNFSRFILLSIAFFDRWLALAKPFTYQTSVFVRHHTICLVTPIVMTCIIVLIRDIVFSEDFCIDQVHGIINCIADGPKFMTCASLYPLAFAFNTIFIILLFRELRKMKRSPASKVKDVQLKRTVRTVIAIVLIYYACFIWDPLVQVWSKLPSVTEKMARDGLFASYIFYSLYGLFNILVYGIINKSYRMELQTLIGNICFQLKRKVEPK